MTVRADDRAFTNRVTIRLVDLDLLFQVAGLAHPDFRQSIQHGVVCCVDTMATVTANILGGMGTVLPVHVIALVTGQANLALRLDDKVVSRIEVHAGDLQRILGVFRTRTMTGFAGVVG